MAAVTEQAAHLNSVMFPANPLPLGEIKATAKSIARFTHRMFTEEGFSQIQAHRGRKGGEAKGTAYQEKRAEALRLLASGVTQVEIAERLGVTTRTVRNWKSGK